MNGCADKRSVDDDLWKKVIMAASIELGNSAKTELEDLETHLGARFDLNREMALNYCCKMLLRIIEKEKNSETAKSAERFIVGECAVISRLSMNSSLEFFREMNERIELLETAVQGALLGSLFPGIGATGGAALALSARMARELSN